MLWSAALVSWSVLLTSLPHAVESGWIDPDTPSNFHSTVAHTKDDAREYALVSRLQGNNENG